MKNLYFCMISLLSGLFVFTGCESMRDEIIGDNAQKKWKLFDFGGKKKKEKATTSLMDAVVRDDMELVGLILDQGADINSKDSDKWTALVWAIHYERPKIAKYLIKRGADVNVLTRDKKTPLAMALRSRQKEIAKILIEKGADLNHETYVGNSEVSTAIRHQCPELAKLMLEKGVFLMGSPRGKEFPLCIAHRGDSANFPENTHPAFQGAIENGADMIELDVSLSKDGEIIVCHDSTLERTTDGEGQICEKDLDELRELDAGEWFDDKFIGIKLPTLKEVFEKYGDKVLFNVEMKSDIPWDPEHKLETKLVDLVESESLLNSVVISSFDYQQLRTVRRLNDKIHLSLLSEKKEPIKRIINLVKAIDAFSYNPYWEHLTPEMIKKLHHAGIMVFPWSNKEDNTAETMEKVLAMHADAFFANDPAVLKELTLKHRKPDRSKK